MCTLQEVVAEFGTSKSSERPSMREVVQNGRLTSNFQKPISAERSIVEAHLRALRETLLTSLVAMFVSVVIGIIAASSLIVYVQTGTSFLHPYLGMLLAFGSVALLGLAVASALVTRRQIESAMAKVLLACFGSFAQS